MTFKLDAIVRGSSSPPKFMLKLFTTFLAASLPLRIPESAIATQLINRAAGILLQQSLHLAEGGENSQIARAS